mgnify:CR=1 FL=1
MSASSKSHKEKDIASAFVSLGVLIMLAAIAVIFFKIEANIAKRN